MSNSNLKVKSISGDALSANEDARFVTVNEMVKLGKANNKLPCIFSVDGRYHIGLSGGLDEEEVVVGEFPFMKSFPTECLAREVIVDAGSIGVVVYGFGVY